MNPTNTDTHPARGSLAKSRRVETSPSAASMPVNATATSRATNGSFLGKLLIFLGFPTIMGLLGLYVGYLETSREESSRSLSFDHDFALPFALTLAICVVIGFQTGGFTMNQPKSSIVWPKVRTRKKFVHKHIVRSSNHQDHIEGSVEDSKKDD